MQASLGFPCSSQPAYQIRIAPLGAVRRIAATVAASERAGVGGGIVYPFANETQEIQKRQIS